MKTSLLGEYSQELQTVWDALVRRDAMPEHADAIVVGGCRDVGLAKRAAELYHAGVSGLIIVTGYQPKTMDTSEARHQAKKCIELGVPKDAILLEEQASNTGENILFSARMLESVNRDIKSVILIHKPYVSLRFYATAEAQWPKPQPEFYSTCQSISFKKYCSINGFEKTINRILSGLKRMDSYVAEGFQTAQPIPDAARAAYAKLVDNGFATR